MSGTSARKTVVAGCYQFRIDSGEVEANLRRVERSLPWFQERGCQLLVLPEMWPCGFVYRQLPDMAGRTPQVLGAMRLWAVQNGLVLVGSLPEALGGVIYNTVYVVDANGEMAGSYRKMHLFSLHGEDRHFGRGTQPLVCNTRVGRIGVMICYDLRFPELARRLALDGAELLCISALWPTARIEHWSILLRARAIENQLFVIGCNGSGKEARLTIGGKSALISPFGHTIAEAGSLEEQLIAPLNMQEMGDFRELIPCLTDRLPGGYGIS
jgi:predicted amidohydrolase